jgi:hypothetical protein
MIMEETQNEGQTEAVEIDDEKIVHLRKPVEFAKVTYERINLREPLAWELSKATKAGGDVDTAIMLISLVSKVPKGAVEKLCQRDLQECSDFLGSFSALGQITGETSSQS